MEQNITTAKQSMFHKALVYFSSIMKSRSNSFLEPTSTKQRGQNLLLKETMGALYLLCILRGSGQFNLSVHSTFTSIPQIIWLMAVSYLDVFNRCLMYWSAHWRLCVLACVHSFIFDIKQASVDNPAITVFSTWYFKWWKHLRRAHFKTAAEPCLSWICDFDSRLQRYVV